MQKNSYFLRSFLNAVGTFIYIGMIAWLLFHTKEFFGDSGKPDNFLAPIFMLLLFVISASITGLLVLGKPIQLYWDGLKKEALKLLFATLGWLVFFLIAVIISLLIY